MKLDILAISAHPDDVELSCAGTLLGHIAQGYSVGIIDLTMGELGTRGSGPLRLKEAEAARQMMGAAVRENAKLKDGFFEVNEASLKTVIHYIRKYKPEIVLTNSLDDRHPDHGRAAKLVSRSCFLSGLVKIETLDGSDTQEKWRPKSVYHFIQDKNLIADVVVDISPYMEEKLELIKCFKSQFYNPTSKEEETPLTGSDFFDFIKAKAKSFGRPIGAEYAEGFNVSKPIGTKDLLSLT